jgi:ferredoxin
MTGAKTLVTWLARKRRALVADDRDVAARSFPTEGYLTAYETADEGERRHVRLQEEALGMDHEERSRRAAAADARVLRGPTVVDIDNLPYIKEAWEWARNATRAVGLKRRKAPYACVLDALTRMRAAALIERRNLAWPETAAKVAGVDLAWIQVEHGTARDDFEMYVSRAQAVIGKGLEEGWNGVVWGDIDPDDPCRTLEIDVQACRGCGQCVVLCPAVFAKSAAGDVYVTESAAIRDPQVEDCCMDALEQCPEDAIFVRTRGGRTITGQVPPRGRPLPGDKAGRSEA